MTPTGKASNNLIKAGLDARTIHSQIYKSQHGQKATTQTNNIQHAMREYRTAMKEQRTYVTDNYKYKLKEPWRWEGIKELFIVDEGSMVGEKVVTGHTDFWCVLLVGDPNQLDPC